VPGIFCFSQSQLAVLRRKTKRPERSEAPQGFY
jgi:hypothetical protein